MSTNYYFNPGLESIFGGDEDRYPDIHIGKRSAGWKPIFQMCPHFSSVKGIREFYNKHKELLTIINEYDEELTFQELEEELFNWESERNNQSHIPYLDVYYDDEGYEFSTVEFS